jgi:hypothetical protein
MLITLTVDMPCQLPSPHVTGAQHWLSTLALNTGWRSTLALNTSLNP